MVKTNIKIFFAIPCGEFFSLQDKIIKEVCKKLKISAVIIEDHSVTKNLWSKISDEIDTSDYFFADISSKSPNVILELGYAIKSKNPKFYGIFISSNVEVPVDIQGFTLQKYSSLGDFKNKLIKWIKDNIPMVQFGDNLSKISTDLPEEDFLDKDRFLRLWTNPPLASFFFTAEGLRFTNTHFPIMTNYLSLLKDYEFEFKAKIIQGAFGWVVKGTKSYLSILPEFCIMFNIDSQMNLTPHIFNLKNLVPQVGYHVFDSKRKKVSIDISKEGWFTLVTKVVGDNIKIYNGDNLLFEDNFDSPPYSDAYNFDYKQGEVGFRCHPGEEGLVRYVKIREISGKNNSGKR